MKAAFIGNNSLVFDVVNRSLRLRWPDATVLAAKTAANGLALVVRTSPDVLLLHPDVTDMSLTQTIQELRRLSAAPLLVLGYQGDEMEAAIALETGADDYVRLPRDLTEIVTRVWVLMRRADFRRTQVVERLLSSVDLFNNPSSHQAYFNGGRLALTSTEFRLLHLLVGNRGLVVPHRTLERAVWGDQINKASLVRKYVQRLRRKLGDDARRPRWIISVRGAGYQFIGPAFGSKAEPA